MSFPTDTPDDWSELGVGLLPSPRASPSLVGLSRSGSLAAAGFVSVGSVVDLSQGESGGVAKRASLFWVDADDDPRLCLGFIGGGNKRFCLKALLEGLPHCGVSRHAAKKHQPDVNMFYLRSGEGSAFSHPAYPMSLISGEEIDAIKTQQRTVEEWNAFFGKLAEERQFVMDQEGMLEVVEGIRLEFDTNLDLKTPGKTRQGVEWTTNATLTFQVEGLQDRADMAALRNEWQRSTNLPESLIELVSVMHEALQELLEAWPAPFRDIEAQFIMMGHDLVKIQRGFESLKMAVGKSVLVDNIDFPDLWCAVDYLGVSLADCRKQGLAVKDKEELQKALQRLEQLLTNAQQVFQTKCTALDKVLQVHEKRFLNIRPILMELKDRSLHSGAIGQEGMESLHELVERVRQLELRAPSDEWDSLTQRPIPRFGAHDHLDRMSGFEARLKKVEQRVIGEGVALGVFVFQSFEDLRVWVKQNLPNNRFGLFVDGVSIFEFIAFSHTDVSDAINTMYNSQKTGFATMYESMVAASMQNLFPTLFGKSASDGMYTSRFLPGIPSPDKWELGGFSGLKPQIERKLIDVATQLGNSIRMTFQDSSEAAGLAQECLFQAKRFVNDLCNFMSTDYREWSSKGYHKTDAWALTCHSVRRIYEDIHAVRVSARHVRDLEDPHYTATQILWATLRTHAVMTEFVKRSFYEHPSISAVISRHLAINHTKGDEVKQEQHLKLLEDLVKKQSARIDSLESRLNAAKNPKNPKGPKE